MVLKVGGILLFTPKTIHKINASAKSDDLSFGSALPKNLKVNVSKKTYMRRASFWRDAHNSEMFSLYGKLLELRDKISEEILANNSKVPLKEQIQAVNGFAREKKFVAFNPDLNHWENPSVNNRTNYDYLHIKTKIYNLSRMFKSKIGK